MRTPHLRVLLCAILVIGSVAIWSGCVASSQPRQFRTFFLPPAPHPVLEGEEAPLVDPPRFDLRTNDRYANEIPILTGALPRLPRPTDAEFLIKQADDRFAAGKRALQEGRARDARSDFNRAVEILLTAPENLPERARLERRLEALIDDIYRYDADQSSSGDPEPQLSLDKRPLDEILEMTFPVDPSLRNKVNEQIQATASQLPLEQSDAVVSFINFFSSDRGKRILGAGMRRSGRYRTLIQRVLA